MTSDTIILEKITIEFPSKESTFFNQFFKELHTISEPTPHGMTCKKSSSANVPEIELSLAEAEETRALFTLSNGRTIKIPITNMTGIEKASPHEYKKYPLDEVKEKMKEFSLRSIDHMGFNLPWFSGGTHPLIAFLQTNLKNKCLYHLFPSGEAWDFIIPGTREEICNKNAIDYTTVRKPKFELVSFEKCSIPLIQIDVATDTSFERIKKLFIHGIIVEELRQVWVYIDNPLNIDICLVLNEYHDNDWSNFFALSRLQ